MKNLLFRAGAMALVLLASPCLAQAPRAKIYYDEAGKPQGAIGMFCVPAVDGSGCSGGGGGTGGDASAANQNLQLTQEQLMAARLGDITTPTNGSVNQRLALINTTLGTLFQAGQSIGNTGFAINGTLPAFAATPTFNLGTGGAGTSGTPIYTASGTPTNATPGSTAPAYAQQVGGVGPNGNLRALAVGTAGGLMPGQGIVASTRTTMTASTATSIATTATGRVGLSIFAEAALTANVYLCTTQTTGCSATSYDFLVPSGASAGTIYTSLFAPNTAIYAFTTGTPVLVVNSWTAQ